jgi:release factor glutamine methyltransferase
VPTGTTSSVRAVIDDATGRLKRAGVETPRLDTELLLAHVLETTRPNLLAGLAAALTAEQTVNFEQLIARRGQREPVAYITGAKGFRRIDLQVDSRVLIPRSETELLVAVVKVGRPCGILDVGTGSGAVALALADELPDATIQAVDVSENALTVARGNAERLGVAGRVSFSQSDLLASVAGAFDAIAANLPYVASAEMTALQPEITRYEPELALDGGPDGLDLVRKLAGQAPSRLKPGGLLALEIGDDQGAATKEILNQCGFVQTEIHLDLSGRDRVVSGTTPA